MPSPERKSDHKSDQDDHDAPAYSREFQSDAERAKDCTADMHDQLEVLEPKLEISNRRLAIRIRNRSEEERKDNKAENFSGSVWVEFDLKTTDKDLVVHQVSISPDETWKNYSSVPEGWIPKDWIDDKEKNGAQDVRGSRWVWIVISKDTVTTEQLKEAKKLRSIRRDELTREEWKELRTRERRLDVIIVPRGVRRRGKRDEDDDES
jgi:hypothetical protein